MLKFFSLLGFHLFEQTKQCHSMAIQDMCFVKCSIMIIFCYNIFIMTILHKYSDLFDLNNASMLGILYLLTSSNALPMESR